jgi:hypothetical protein
LSNKLSFDFCGQRGGKTLEDSQKNVSTIQRKMYYVNKGIPMGEKVPVAEQASLTNTTQAIQSFHKCWIMLNKLLLWFKRTAGSLIQLTSWTSAVDLHIPSITRILGITKFVQGGCQSSL